MIDARLLVEAAAGVTRADMIADPRRPLTAAQTDALEAMLVRRAAREPVSQILGRKGFWSIVLEVTPDVLTPRPETETILDVVLRRFDAARDFSVLDLGVGSGALLLAVVLERPFARGVGIDISAEALTVASRNVLALRLANRAALARGNWADCVASDRFDLVLCNPPYIPTAEIDRLEPEVRDHEPRIAVDGGPDGLAQFRLLAGEIMRVLRPGGEFAVEIAPTQTQAVAGLFAEAGALGIEAHKDLAGHDRVIAGAKKALGD